MLSSLCASMVLRIIDHDQCVTSPVAVGSIQMLDELADEVDEGVAVGPSLVHSIEEPSITTNGCDGVDRTQAAAPADHVLLEPNHPASLAAVSVPHHALVDIDDPLMFTQELDVLRCSILPLKLRSRVVMVGADGANLSI